jgi:hypothetical protein
MPDEPPALFRNPFEADVAGSSNIVAHTLWQELLQDALIDWLIVKDFSKHQKSSYLESKPT